MSLWINKNANENQFFQSIDCKRSKYTIHSRQKRYREIQANRSKSQKSNDVYFVCECLTSNTGPTSVVNWANDSLSQFSTKPCRKESARSSLNSTYSLKDLSKFLLWFEFVHRVHIYALVPYGKVIKKFL